MVFVQICSEDIHSYLQLTGQINFNHYKYFKNTETLGTSCDKFLPEAALRT